jgi:small neutral amino acid transporter SnatA (MarC family)
MLSVGAIFFITLGPLKLLVPFARRTQGMDEPEVRQTALYAAAIATLVVIGGSLLGQRMLTAWHVSVAALIIAAGIIFFIVALRQLLEQYNQDAQPPSQPTSAGPPASAKALAIRLVFPAVLTPYGMAAVIAALAARAETQRTAVVLGMVLGIMALNLVAMLYARRILSGPVVVVLQMIGAILAVLQAALAVQFLILGVHLAVSPR